MARRLIKVIAIHLFAVGLTPGLTLAENCPQWNDPEPQTVSEIERRHTTCPALYVAAEDFNLKPLGLITTHALPDPEFDQLVSDVRSNRGLIEALESTVGGHSSILSNILTTLGRVNNARRYFRANSDGADAAAPGEEAVALGGGSVADSAYTVAIGRAASAPGVNDGILRRLTYLAPGMEETDAVNLGQLNSVDERTAANADLLSGLETDLHAITDYVAVNGKDVPASARGRRSIAIGEGARAMETDSLALGPRAQALFPNSVAFGFGAKTSRQNQFMFGTSISTYTLPGLTSPRSAATQTGTLQLVTVDSDGNLAGDGGATVDQINADIAQYTNTVSDLERDMGAAQSSITRLDTAVSAQGSRLTQAEADIAANLQGMRDNHEDILQNVQAIEANAASHRANAVQIATNTSGISANTAGLSDHSQAIAENADAIASTQQGVDVNSADIDLLRAGYAGESERFDAVEAKVATHSEALAKADQNIDEHADAIASNQAHINANQVRIAQSDAAAQTNQQAIAVMQSDVTQLQIHVDELALRLGRTERDIDANTAGIAIANALAGSTWLQSNESVAVSLNAGYFEGVSAIAVSGAARFDRHWSANFAVGTVPARGEVGARAGLRLGW
ncbi:MAG: YadA-like family protein [Pseudomonadota bacterium]